MSGLHSHPQISFTSLNHCQSLDVGESPPECSLQRSRGPFFHKGPSRLQRPPFTGPKGGKKISLAKTPHGFSCDITHSSSCTEEALCLRALSSQHSELFGEAVFYSWVVAQQGRAPTAAPAPLPPLGVPQLLTSYEGKTSDKLWMLTGFSDHLPLGGQTQSL